jgi:hypothetical protein
LYADNFYYARDFFYLAGILLGLAVGLFFSFFKKSLNFGQKERRVTAAFWLLSAVVTAAAAAFILSGPELVQNESILITACFIMTAGIFAALFPKTFLFPVIAAGGFCVVIIAFIFLRYPRISDGMPVTRVSRSSTDAIFIEPEYPKFTLANKISGGGPRIKYKNYYNSARPYTFEYAAAAVTIDRVIPLIGGQRRSILTALNLVDDRLLRLKLYVPSRLEEAFIDLLFLYGASPLDARRFFARIELNDLEPYTTYTIYFDGNSGRLDAEEDGGGGKILYKLQAK